MSDLLNNKIVYHIDANFILNYLIVDNHDLNEKVRSKLMRHDWGNDKYRLNTHAIGEISTRLFTKIILKSQINNIELYNKLNSLRRIFKEGYIDILKLNTVKGKWLGYYNELRELDNRIEDADILNLAYFCADSESRIFYTFDMGIAESKKINEYIKQIDGNNRKIKGIE